MPIVHVKILEGRNDDQKKALIENVTAAVVESIDCPKERVSVHVEEMAKTNFGVAGVRMSDQ